MKTENKGFILFITLIILFVLTVILVASSDEWILSNKMQSNSENQLSVFEVAELALQQAEFAKWGDPVALPVSSVVVVVTQKVISVDSCGNQKIYFTSTAHNALATVVLNSLSIFAKVPRQKGCASIPLHQTIYWKDDS